MGYESQLQIPVIEFTKDMVRGTDGWQSLCKRVREACESFGCFEVVYDKISSHLRDETFSLIKELCNLPVQTKRKNFTSKPLHGYYEPGGEFLPFYESFGIDDASNCNSVRSFADLMWPTGHDHFCKTINTLMKELEELSHMIGLMILDSYGLGEKPETMMRHYQLLRVMKYLAPPSGECTEVAMAHTDKFSSAILCENHISGLEIETKDGEWIKLVPSPSSLVFIVGDLLTAWSNGRMHAAKHTVKLSGNKERYSLGAFAVPVEGTIIKAPKEMVDEQHPQLFKDFDYMDFVNYAVSHQSLAIDNANKLFKYAARHQL
ncbi:Oxoglutarate/iron-dependent dioxygenase [Corchorus capsularis]|uniref:2-oxoglutarate-dependent dioxygenase DAO n=1 Tax=Corchorus capsularis TaxID=210143 RepID=A0A1R3G2U4_COCAP|nr:Oxoglutarate/iron-dependent dioxygenase [Corchorus capsularis]